MKALHRLRRLIASLLAVLGCAALVALPLARPAAVAAQDPDGPFILSVPIIASNHQNIGVHPLGVQLYGSLADSAISHTLFRRAQVSWIRWEVTWAGILPTEPVPGEAPDYKWGIDASAQQARDLGLNVIATINSNPEWATLRSVDGQHWYTNGPIDPDHYDEFARLVAAMAARYPWITHFELYNEPDNSGMAQAESPNAGPYWGLYGKEYADMLKVVYPALKAANPQAQLVFGGIAYDMFASDACSRSAPEQCEGFYRPFLDDVLAAGGGDYFDVFNFHYYPEFASLWEPYGHDLIGKVNVLRATLAKYGHGDKPVVCTEVGISSGPKPYDPTPTPESQARYIVQTAARSMAAGLDVMIWWAWKNFSAPPFEHYGLVTLDLQPKLGLEAFRTAALKIGEATYVGSLGLEGQGVEGYEFAARSGRRVYVLWSVDGATHSVTLPSTEGTVSGMSGEALGIVGDPADGLGDGQINVSVGVDPIFVEGSGA